MIYNYTKCESVIAKIMADLDISETKLRITDIKEWIFEAVDKIGAPMQYITKESGVDGEPLLQMHEYQVPIPCGLQSLDGVAYGTSPNGPWIPMRSETSNFKSMSHRENIPHLHSYHDDIFIEKKPTIPAQFWTRNYVKYAEKMLFNGTLEQPTYFIKPGWIVTNKRTGFIKLSYKTIAVDECGYPLIPDLSSYQEAIYWYVVMKLSFPKYLSGKLGGKGVNSAQNTYFYTQQQWNFYRNQAYAEAMMPDEGTMRSIKNDWNKLIPDYESDRFFYKNQGVNEIDYNDYYYGY